MIDGRNFFDQTIKNGIKTYENIQKITTGERDDCTTGCLLDYNYLKRHYKLLAIDLSKEQALDANLKAIQQINVSGKVSGNNNRFFISE